MDGVGVGQLVSLVICLGGCRVPLSLVLTTGVSFYGIALASSSLPGMKGQEVRPVFLVL